MERLVAAPVLAMLLLLTAVAPAAGGEREDSLGELARAVLAGGGATSADFDGDRRSDLAVAVPDHGSMLSTQYTVDLKFSNRVDRTSFKLQSHPGGLDLAPRDIDGDRDVDLVVTTRFSGKHVGVWVNDGTGNLSRGNSTEYPTWIWGHGPRLIRESASEKRPAAILSPCSMFVLCSVESSVVRPIATCVGYDEPDRAVRPFSRSCYIRPPPRFL